jgi:ankyrin repeat protein
VRSNRMISPASFGASPNSARKRSLRWRRLHPISLASAPTGVEPAEATSRSHAYETSRRAGSGPTEGVVVNLEQLRKQAKALVAAAEVNAENAFFVNEHGRMSALYGAAGRLHDPGLTRLLLEAGANPDDGESLYHATEAESPECLSLLLERGAETRRTNALAHALDDDHLDHVRLLLEAGADPNEGAMLAHAVRRGRGPEFLRLLAGAWRRARPAGWETWRGNVPLRTPYQHAVLRGRAEQAEALAELGASTEIDQSDLAVAAVARGERPETPLPDDLDPDAQEVLILAALRGRLELVLDLVGPDFSGVVGGSPEGTLLQHAAWVGDPELVRELLARGAHAKSPDNARFGTPLGWASHGSAYHALPGRDYVAVAEALVAAGDPIDPCFLEEAEGPLYSWLADRLS